MAENKKSVLLYCDIIHTVKELDDADAGLLFKHYLSYINDENPDPPSKLIKIVFEPIKQTLKRDLRKWEQKSIKNSNSARIRWNKENANASERIERNANHADIVKVIVNDKVIVNTIDVHEVSKFLSIAFSKKYNRDEGGQTGQDIDDLSKELLKCMTKKTIMDQVRAYKLFIGLHEQKPASKLETIRSNLLENDWIQKLKDSQDKEKLQNGLNNEQARRSATIGSGTDLPPANLGILDN